MMITITPRFPPMHMITFTTTQREFKVHQSEDDKSINIELKNEDVYCLHYQKHILDFKIRYTFLSRQLLFAMANFI